MVSEKIRKWAIVGADGTLYAFKKSKADCNKTLIEDFPNKIPNPNPRKRKFIVNDRVLEQPYYILPIKY